MTYSTVELEPIAQRLRARGVELRARIACLHADSPAENSIFAVSVRSRGTQLNDEVTEEIMARAECELFRIKEALRRIQAGTYGVCATCGSPVEAKRLRVIPYAERCSDCSASPALIHRS